MANSPIIYGPSGSLFIGVPQGSSNTVLTNDGAGNLTWGTSAGITPVKNYLLNSGYEFQQEFPSGTTIAAGTNGYVADQWFMLNTFSAGSVMTITRVTPSLDGSNAALSLESTTAETSPSTGAFVYLCQKLEQLDNGYYLNGVATFSIQVKALGNVNQVQVAIGAAPGFSATTDITSQFSSTISVNSSTYTQATITGTLISSGMPFPAVYIAMSGVSSGNLSDIGNGILVEQASLSPTSIAIPWVRCGESYADELRLCQRYYEKSYPVDIQPMTASQATYGFQIAGQTSNANGQYYADVRFAITKYKTPGIGTYSYAGVANTSSNGAWLVGGGGSDNNNGGGTPAGATVFGFSIYNNSGTTQSLDNFQGLNVINWVADARG